MMDISGDAESDVIVEGQDHLFLPVVTTSLSLSLGSSLGLSQDFRRQLKPPNKKKYDEEMDELQKQIRTKEAELKSLGIRPAEVVTAELRGLRAEKDAAIGQRKKMDADLKLLNLELTKKMGQLSRIESNLHYKSEAKIDDAIRKMEWQLKVQNFKLSEERRVVAEVDKLKRSKKVLAQYFTQKKEVDETRDSQRRMRGEREYFYRTVTNLKNREEQLKKSSTIANVKAAELKKEINSLVETKRKFLADYKKQETDFQRMKSEHKVIQRKESFRRREEERIAKEKALRKEQLDFVAQKEPFADEKNLCNTLMSYLQRYCTADLPSPRDEVLPSPRDEQPDTAIGQALGVADSLDDGMFVLLKKSDDTEVDYTIANKRKRSRKGRKLSVTKPLAHTPQIISQFSSLNLYAPSNVSEISTSLELLQARKRYYNEHSADVTRPFLGNLSGSFSSSGSLSSLDSPLRERISTWGFVPPPIFENQTPSDAGISSESGFHDMSRQASKTESSESMADLQTADQVLEELIQQSAECAESEHSRSSSDTITPDDAATDDTEVKVTVDYSGDHDDEIEVKVAIDRSVDHDDETEVNVAVDCSGDHGNETEVKVTVDTGHHGDETEVKVTVDHTRDIDEGSQADVNDNATSITECKASADSTGRDNPSGDSHDNDYSCSSVFEETDSKTEDLLRGHNYTGSTQTYNLEFPHIGDDFTTPKIVVTCDNDSCDVDVGQGQRERDRIAGQDTACSAVDLCSVQLRDNTQKVSYRNAVCGVAESHINSNTHIHEQKSTENILLDKRETCATDITNDENSNFENVLEVESCVNICTSESGSSLQCDTISICDNDSAVCSQSDSEPGTSDTEGDHVCRGSTSSEAEPSFTAELSTANCRDQEPNDAS